MTPILAGGADSRGWLRPAAQLGTVGLVDEGDAGAGDAAALADPSPILPVRGRAVVPPAVDGGPAVEGERQVVARGHWVGHADRIPPRMLEHMPDRPRAERIVLLEGLRDWLAYQLRQTERTLEQLKREEEEERRRLEEERIAGSWKLQPGRVDGAEPMLHRADCRLYKTQLGYLDRAHVDVALEEFPRLEMCQICAPWGSLGLPAPEG